MRVTAPLAFLVAALCLFGDAPAYGQVAAEQAQPRSVAIADHVAEASQRFGLPESWIYAVMRTESAGRIGAVSPAGAMGLMQLMPGTWARQRARLALGSDPFDPRDNIMAGTSYLREMYDSYGATGMLAAYNAGPGRYEEWRDKRRPLPAETRAYVAKIAPELQTASTATVVASASPVPPVRLFWTQSQLFAARSESSDGASGSDPAAPLRPIQAQNAPFNGLFAPVSGSGTQ
ncbi:lytic transglycosylase domain-containing protein [Novosphingobium sp.]|uniref:lytic transglycosylase domain-containing protein n=1 Tax=Novosphingobium sp. TaxID=1874826 RepID=UPI0027360CEA|nr:lytic transglycosylase domain-containing protein [Novosphingobium sp.]MDP3907528.1 lytic transglycosylase domain-containing protein [Novosphingobium sp.]